MGHELTIDWGEGSPQTVAVTGGVFDITTSIGMTIPRTPSECVHDRRDADGRRHGYGHGQHDDHDYERAPSIDSLGATSVNENGTVHLTGTYSDAGTQDTHTLTINWGEGSPRDGGGDGRDLRHHAPVPGRQSDRTPSECVHHRRDADG